MKNIIMYLLLIGLNLYASNVDKAIEAINAGKEESSIEYHLKIANENQELSIAIPLWKNNCDNNKSDYCLALGILYTSIYDDRLTGNQYFDKGCKNNNLQSCVFAGFYYPKTYPGKNNMFRPYSDEDEAKRHKYYMKACDGGYDTGCFRVAYNYYAGAGAIEKDYEKALEYFRKDKTKRGESYYKDLIPTVELFDVKLRTATRDEIWEALAKIKIKIERQNKQYWSDIYNARDILDGASQLNISYTLDNKFAIAKYTFTKQMSFAKLNNILTTKYGDATYKIDNHPPTSLYTWSIKRGNDIEIKLTNSNVLTLEYIHPYNYNRMLKSQEQQKKQKDIEKANKQSNAF